MDKYNGKIPRNIEELEKLPGVGHKTASVVISKCFNVPAFPVDTHIHRLAQRWGLSKGKNVTQTEKDLKKYFLYRIGTNYTYKLFFTVENIVQQEDVMEQNAIYVKFVIRIEKRELKQIKLRGLVI